MSYLLGGLDLIVNNQTINVVSTTIVNGDITPSEKIIAVGNAYNRFTNPDSEPSATIKSTNTSASLTNLTAKAIGTTVVPIAPTVNSNLNNTLNLTYDGEYYVKLLLGTATTSTTISDSSNNDYNIISSNVNANALNPFGSGSTYNSLLFNGTTSFLTIDNPISTFLGSEDFTIEFFINPTNFTGGPVLIDTGTNLGFQYWQVALTATGTVQFIYTYGITTVTLVTTTTLTAATWSHVALVRNNTVQTPGNNFNIYINGVSGVSALIANKWGDTGTIASSISIGKRLGNTRYFNGYLSNLRITQAAVYTSAFTKPTATLEITQSAGTNILLIPAGQKLYTKYSTTGNTGANYEPMQINLYDALSYNTPFGQKEVYDPVLIANSIINSYLAPTTNKNIKSDTEIINVDLVPEFYINGSDAPNILGITDSSSSTTFGGASFNGSTQYLSLPASSNLYLTGAFTWETWVYPISSSGIIYGNWNTIGNVGQGINAWAFMYVNAGGTNGGLAKIFWYRGTYGLNEAAKYSTVPLPLNQWNHLVFQRDSSNNISIFLNGVSLPLFNYGANGLTEIGNNTSFTNSYPITIGGSPSQTYFQGYLSNMRFVQGTAIYSGNFTTSKSDLTAISGTALLTLNGNTIVDRSTNNFTITNNGGVSFVPGQVSYSLNYGSPSSITLINAAPTSIYPGTYSFTSVTDNFDFKVEILGGRSSNAGYLGIGLKNLATSGLTYAVEYAQYVAYTSSGLARKLINYAFTNLSASTPFRLRAVKTGASISFFITDINDVTIYSETVVLSSGVNYSVFLYYNKDTSSDTQIAKILTDTIGQYSFIDNSVTTSAAGSLSFNGTSQYITAPNSTALEFGTGDFTVEYWVYFTSTPSAASQFPVSKWAANTGWELYYTGSTNKFAFYALAGTPFLVGTTTPIANSWYHLAVSRAGGTIRLFVNGVQEASVTGDTSNFNDTNTLYIGKENNTTNIYFNGYISNLRIVKGTAVYASTFAPIIPLTDISNTSLLLLINSDANKIIDSSSSPITLTNAGGATYSSIVPSITTGNVLVINSEAYISTPSVNETNIEYINYKTDPRLVNKRVKNLIVGTTGVLEELQSWS